MAFDCFRGPTMMARGSAEFASPLFHHGKTAVTQARYEVANGEERALAHPGIDPSK